MLKSAVTAGKLCGECLYATAMMKGGTFLVMLLAASLSVATCHLVDSESSGIPILSSTLPGVHASTIVSNRSGDADS